MGNKIDDEMLLIKKKIKDNTSISFFKLNEEEFYKYYSDIFSILRELKMIACLLQNSNNEIEYALGSLIERLSINIEKDVKKIGEITDF